MKKTVAMVVGIGIVLPQLLEHTNMVRLNCPSLINALNLAESGSSFGAGFLGGFLIGVSISSKEDDDS